MAIDREKLLNWPFKEVEHTYTFRDTILYALGLGVSIDQMDEDQLRFTYEENLQCLPSMAVVLGGPGFWVKDPESGVDWVKVLHGEQGMVIHKPLPAEATVVGLTKVTDVIDKGEGKGALILQERTVHDKSTGDLLATLTSTTFARGDGGIGGGGGPGKPVHQLPDRDPDMSVDMTTHDNQALIYRLSGDYNPLHADPKVARGGGFDKPILHGLCTLGIASHAILQSQCSYDPAKFKTLDLRFSSPVYPGETIRTEMWRDDNIVSFRSRVVERDIVVLNNGRAEVG
jgi:acyl dehydratase